MIVLLSDFLRITYNQFMAEIFVKNKIFNLLNQIAVHKKLSLDDLCHDILLEYIINLQNTMPIKKESSLVKFYKLHYKEKFGLETNENFNEELISAKINEINENFNDPKETLLFFKKIIVWYIYHNNNVNQNGDKIPHKLNTLMKEKWLFQKAVENIAGKNLELIIKSGEGDMDISSFNKALKRGDVGNQNHMNVSQKIEDLLIRMISMVEKFDNNIKKHPKISKLYESEIPSAEYIKNATIFIEKLERMKNE